MALSFPLPKFSKSAWSRLVAPMLLASLGLHGLLLLLPVGPSKDGSNPSADLEKDSIAITRVAPSSAPPPPSGMPATMVKPGAVGAAGAAVPRPTSQARPLSRSDRSPTQRQSRSSPPPAPPAPAVSSAPASVSRSPSPALPASRPLTESNLGERLLAYVGTLKPPADQIDRLARYLKERFAYNQAATQGDTYDRNLEAWQTSIRQSTTLSELTPEADGTDFSLKLPQRVCLRQLPTEVKLGVLAAANGSQLEAPVVLLSSGYGAVDRQAQDLVSQHPFPAAASIKAYTVAVATQVDYGQHPCLGEGSGP